MEQKWIILAVLALTALSLPGKAAIETAKISFSVNSDLAVAETIELEFDQPLNSILDYNLDEAVTGIEVRDSRTVLDYDLLESDPGYVLRIYPQGDTKLIIKFVSKTLVFQNNDIYQFFTELSFAESIGKTDVSVTLPEGFGVVGSYKPANGTVTSNGRNVILEWVFINYSEPAIFSVKFERLAKELNLWVVVAILAIGASAYAFKYYSKRSREEFMLGFREDEKKVIEYMEQHKTAYQNKIEHEFKFSRAKMTRIVQKLCENGLMEKKRKGRTNRLTWLKK